MEIVIQVVAAILVFGLLIFVHELGHFTVGKLSGMRVNQFAIGMGPAIWSKQRGETKYAIRCFRSAALWRSKGKMPKVLIQGPFVTCGFGSGLRLSVQGH